MKTYTLVNKKNRNVVLTIQAISWDIAEIILQDLGINYSEDWDY